MRVHAREAEEQITPALGMTGAVSSVA
jgi:hypothetical protein